MLKKEAPFAFKKELLQVHKKNVRDFSRKPAANEFEITEGIRIVLPQEENIVIETAAKDFIDYLFVSMGVPAMLVKACPADCKAVRLSLSQNLGEEANGYMGYAITVDEQGISVTGYDAVGVAQGLYFLEDLMNIRKAPFLEYGTQKRKALFDMRLTQSPFGMFEYPDEALALIAHRGYNVIDLWIKDDCTTLRGDFIDLQLLCERAEKFGIQVYAELYALHTMHPDDEGSQEFYDNLYGTLFKNCPKLAGITLVGEANQFQSRDPRVGRTPYTANFDEEIPTGKVAPGWWPCSDFPALVDMIKKAVRKVQPTADIIVSTYNWGFAPEEDRIKLIEALPTDISLLPTWDMFHQFRRGEAVFHIADYSLQFAGPGEYFASEAIAAQKRGIKLYSITNASGRTWDFGVVPYEPMSTCWIKRFEGLQKAHSEWGLAGMVENIHYGFHPSIIGDLEKWAFFSPCRPLNEVLDILLERDFEEDAARAGRAMECFSEAVHYYSITANDQYGAFRIGPSYPFWVENPGSSGKKPAQRHAMFGNGIYTSEYAPSCAAHGSLPLNSLPGVRIFVELESVKKMRDLMQQGIEILEFCPHPNDNLLRLLNLARFMHNTVVSGIHIKELYILRQKLSLAGTTQNAETLIDEMEALLLRERKNAEDTIPLVQVDSRLGWEPSMEYTTDEDGLRWKLRQIDYELTCTLPTYRKANRLAELLPEEE